MSPTSCDNQSLVSPVVQQITNYNYKIITTRININILNYNNFGVYYFMNNFLTEVLPLTV